MIWIVRTDQRLFDGVEVILHCISTAAVTLSVESSVETLVSRYEIHLDKTQQLTEQHADEEKMDPSL